MSKQYTPTTTSTNLDQQRILFCTGLLHWFWQKKATAQTVMDIGINLDGLFEDLENKILGLVALELMSKAVDKNSGQAYDKAVDELVDYTYEYGRIGATEEQIYNFLTALKARL